MACYKPLQGFWKLGGGITFSPVGSNGMPLSVNCGQCIGCRIDKKREWAVRLVHESKMHSSACFITLTYNPESLPRGGTLVKRHVQLFMKNLREKIKPIRIRYFAVGEYGDRFKRPHYHLIIFGWWPNDARCVNVLNENRQYESDILAQCWPHGYHDLQDFGDGAALYTSGYVMKKVKGNRAKEHYTHITPDGEMIDMQPEFALMSTRPGIGATFYDKYERELRVHDGPLLGQQKIKMPRYYDKLYERKEGAHSLQSVKDIRRAKMKPHKWNNTPERLAVREKCAEAKQTFKYQNMMRK